MRQKTINLKTKGIVSDKGVVTSKLGSTSEFNEAFIAAIAQHHHWILEKTENVPE